MTATSQDVEVVSGDAITLNVTVEDADGSTFDLSGAEITYALGDTSSGPVVEKTVGDGVTVTDAANGEFEVFLAEADTADLAGYFEHEVEVVSGVGAATVLQGGIMVRRDLIR